MAAVRTLAPGTDLNGLRPERKVPEMPLISVGHVAGQTVSGNPVEVRLPEISCDPELIGSGDLPVGMPGLKKLDPSQITYGPDDDVVMHRTDKWRPESWPGQQAIVDAGAGDDRITVFGADVLIRPGAGADTLLVCGGGEGVTLDVLAPADDAPDVVVLAASLFAPTGIPGVSRRVSISGMGDEGDVVVLQLPPGATVSHRLSHLLVDHAGQATGIWTGAAPPDFKPGLNLEEVVLWQ